MERHVHIQGKLVQSHIDEEDQLFLSKKEAEKVGHAFESIPQSGLKWLSVTFESEQRGTLSVRYLLEQTLKNNEIEVTVLEPRKTNWVAIHPDAVEVALHYRISGEGQLSVSPLDLYGETEPYPFHISKADTLVVSTAYPHKDHLYRHGFIHTRLVAYQQNDVEPIVLVLKSEENVIRSYVHEGIRVIEAASRYGDWIIKESGVSSLLIHFLNENIYKLMQTIQPRLPSIVWIHGVETEAWYRRWFQFLDNASDLKHAIELKGRKERQLELIHRLYRGDDPYVSFVHVSEWFKTRVAEVDAKCVTRHSTIIPNPIDDEHFKYETKKSDARFNVLSIRPYHTTKYGNDLAVRAVELLQNEPWFEDVTFSFYGDGPLFDDILQPLSGMKNVIIQQGFLTKEKIYELHQQHGIFLCPTRLDSQGVSMCEAMSSGLVPVTNDVAAISEFVEHEKSGLLAKAESAEELADHIKRLVENESTFLEMSMQASESIRAKCGIKRVVSDELKWISKMSSSCN